MLAAKYHILSDDLSGFAEAIAAMHACCLTSGNIATPPLRPAATNLRAAYLKSLDDLPTSVFPLQSATLINDKRLGAISMRSIMVAEKKLPARAGEAALDSSAIHDAFMRIEPVEQLAALHKTIGTIAASLASLRQLFIDQAGYEVAPQFDQLPALATTINDYLAEVLATRAPSETGTLEIGGSGCVRPII